LDDDYTLAILHLDYQQRLQLCARDIDVDAFELSQYPSSMLNSTFISNKIIPYPTDSVPHLIPIQPEATDDGINMCEYNFQGGVLVVGGMQILLFELSSRGSQEKVKGKRKRLEAKKKSTDAAEVFRAKAKELERESRKKKPNAVVEWPWSNITTYVFLFKSIWDNFSIYYSRWCCVDDVPSRFILGDSFGRLALLSVGNVKEFGLILIPLGQV
jgi:DNA damage-binding protein 1